jgi:hypothetical protein
MQHSQGGPNAAKAPGHVRMRGSVTLTPPTLRPARGPAVPKRWPTARPKAVFLLGAKAKPPNPEESLAVFGAVSHTSTSSSSSSSAATGRRLLEPATDLARVADSALASNAATGYTWLGTLAAASLTPHNLAAAAATPAAERGSYGPIGTSYDAEALTDQPWHLRTSRSRSRSRRRCRDCRRLKSQHGRR